MFESITGQDHAIEQLMRALARPVNTYVFYGSRGTYVEEAARIFSSRLIDPTGAIENRVLNSLYADVIEFEPMGVSYRVKEDVRESMQSELRKSPVEGNKKVLIVHDAYLLRADSANTLLKSLEEPPENVFWILIAPSIDSLIATIRSRSYAIEFARLTPEIIENRLVLEGVDKNRAREVSQISSGRIDRARNLTSHFAPLEKCALEVASKMKLQSSYVVQSARAVVETFDEIASDVVAANKLEMEAVKKEMKDSGYSDKVASSIVSTTKTRIEAKEKRLRHELLYEFLDALSRVFVSSGISNPGEQSTSEIGVIAGDTVNEYRKRLVFNPSELLFLESLLASLCLRNSKVNS